MRAATQTSRPPVVQQRCTLHRLHAAHSRTQRAHALGDGGEGSSSNSNGINITGTVSQLKPPLAPAATSKQRHVPQSTGDGAAGTVVVTETPGTLPLSADADPSASSNNRWYIVVALAALSALVCAIDRAAISVAILPMSETYGWSDTTKGAINSAFYAGGALDRSTRHSAPHCCGVDVTAALLTLLAKCYS